jgi:hypothetical protein
MKLKTILFAFALSLTLLSVGHTQTATPSPPLRAALMEFWDALGEGDSVTAHRNDRELPIIQGYVSHR